MYPAMLVHAWEKLLPGLEDDLQDFPIEGISKSKILNMMCAL
jgi:hypothetical protein